MKKLLYTGLVMIMLLGLLTSACAQPAAPQEPAAPAATEAPAPA